MLDFLKPLKRKVGTALASSFVTLLVAKGVELETAELFGSAIFALSLVVGDIIASKIKGAE